MPRVKRILNSLRALFRNFGAKKNINKIYATYNSRAVRLHFNRRNESPLARSSTPINPGVIREFRDYSRRIKFTL